MTISQVSRRCCQCCLAQFVGKQNVFLCLQMEEKVLQFHLRSRIIIFKDIFLSSKKKLHFLASFLFSLAVYLSPIIFWPKKNHSEDLIKVSKTEDGRANFVRLSTSLPRYGGIDFGSCFGPDSEFVSIA